MADNKVNSGLLEFSEDQKVFVALDAETSEVQKAVTIDGDGVETDMLGVQPSGKKEITSTAEVNVASYATAQVVDEDLVAGNIKKDVDILGVVGTYEPEAPASDFSTVEMTITNSSEQSVDIFGSIAMDGEYGDPDLTYPIYTALANSTNTIKLILYKGVCCLIFDSVVPTQHTGNIEITDTEALVTGNCTITFLGQG